jgi:hypothetical protein
MCSLMQHVLTYTSHVSVPFLLCVAQVIERLHVLEAARAMEDSEQTRVEQARARLAFDKAQARMSNLHKQYENDVKRAETLFDEQNPDEVCDVCAVILVSR